MSIKQIVVEMKCTHCLGQIKVDEAFVVFGEFDQALHLACYLCRADLTHVPMNERPCNIRLNALKKKQEDL
jgi:hypothetical protein